MITPSKRNNPTKEKKMAFVTLANGAIFDTTTENTIEKVESKLKKNVKGFVVYDGKSVLNGEPIVAIVTLNTANEKTGNMAQLWILRSDMSPVEAVQQKADDAICGRCPHRHNQGGACYVQPFQAPYAVYKAFKNGVYGAMSEESKDYFFGRFVRLGAYGDPAAIPANILIDFVKHFKGYTGYTHQARHPNFDNNIATICMISCETEKEAQQQQKQGRKTFRIKTEKMVKMENEITCLSDANGLTCLECGLCNAQSVNVVIDIHGTRKKRFDKFERII